MKNLIIEGLTGAGKSTVTKLIIKILNSKNINYQVTYEDETYGELLDEISNENLTDEQKIFRLKNIVKTFRYSEHKINIFERFHLSYYAVIPDWEIYYEIDNFLSENNFLLVLLHYDEKYFINRALKHNNLKDSEWQQVIDYFGSEVNALESYKSSQDRRKESLQKTKIKYLEIDTSEMEWEKYAETIFEEIII